MLQVSIISRHIRRRSPHIKPNHGHGRSSFRTGTECRLGIPNHSPRWTRQNSLMTSEIIYRSETAIALHKGELDLRQVRVKSSSETVEVRGDFGSEIGSGTGRVASGDHFDHGHDSTGHGNFRKACQLLGPFSHEFLMVGKGVRMTKANGQTFVSIRCQLLQRFLDQVFLWHSQGNHRFSRQAHTPGSLGSDDCGWHSTSISSIRVHNGLGSGVELRG
mmetsp:Transcript_2182/g.3961  ORF Transcript_2182/g.3961 Transcript_2182/m.3961 type:complete len:218 (+) Transcript_2182:426-1079(+)